MPDHIRYNSQGDDQQGCEGSKLQGDLLPVGGECLRPDQRQELSRDLLAVSVREEEEEEKREEDHPHHLEIRS